MPQVHDIKPPFLDGRVVYTAQQEMVIIIYYYYYFYYSFYFISYN